MARITLKNIRKSYDQKSVLNNINMIIEEGKFTVLLGPSGSGKTTLLHGIAGLVSFDHGDIFFYDKLMNHVSIDKRNAVLVDQNLLLFPHMNVKDNIAFGLKMRRVNKNEIQQKVEELVRLLELNGHENKYPNELSGGQMQRVAIARALAIGVEVLLLDEPFSKLDIVLRKNMQEFVRNLQQTLKITILMVTHDQEEALSIADKVALLINGEIKQYDTPHRIYEKPGSKEVADFFGVRNYMQGNIVNGKLRTEIGIFDTTLPNHEEITFMFRPEEIILVPNHSEGIKGVVVKRVYSGDKIVYTIKVQKLSLVVSSFTHKDYQIDDEVNIKLMFDQAVYFK
ncbi:MAG: ABC transporter ATP-binding protein [Erysipelotrichia bacterium]|jgi:ABC-type Fe3+/spermidine/putrescine transport system ATPase subunit|nr:ABC transporter ATP-binding protein [Erysipelotrichia bacterium]